MESVTVLFPVPLGPSMVTMGGTGKRGSRGLEQRERPGPGGVVQIGRSSGPVLAPNVRRTPQFGQPLWGRNGAGDLSLPDQGSRRPLQMHAHRELPAP